MTRVTADNLYGLSDFIVDSSSAHGAYNTIQAAYNAADGAGGGTIYIRANPGGSYFENLTINSLNRISFIAVAAPPVAGVGSSAVSIIGQMTYTATGFHSFQNIDFSFNTTPINLANIAPASVSFTDCTMVGFAAGANGIEYNGQDTMTQRYSGCTVIGDRALRLGGVPGSNVQLIAIDSQFLANTSDAVGDFCFVPGSATFFDCTFSGQAFGINLQGNTQGVTYGGQIVSTLECFNINGGSARCFNSTLFCTASGTGFNVTGNGQFIYDGISSEGVDIGINPTVNQSQLDWKPYAQAAVAPALPAVPAVRGTCCFDNTQFTVTDGFVQLSGGSSFTWVDQGAPVTVASNQGNFVTADITLTLPPAPVQGDTCKFKMRIAPQPMVIAANAGQTLQIAAQSGTTATSTSQGDAMELTYQAATTTWCADAIIGSWIIA